MGVKRYAGLVILLAARDAVAFNSEEHKLVVDLGASAVVVPPGVQLPDGVSFRDGTTAEDLDYYRAAKQLAVGFASNDVAQYSADRQKVQDNSYWTAYTQRGNTDAPYAGNLWIWIPDEMFLSARRLNLDAAEWPGNPFTLGQLAALYGDYRKTTFCDAAGCALTNYSTVPMPAGVSAQMTFDNGTDLFPTQPFNPGYRPSPIPFKTYLQHIGSGLCPPYGPTTPIDIAADDEFDYDEVGWWGDEMVRIAAVNDWHFSTAGLAFYVGMHRLALKYVQMAVTDPAHWKTALHYEANALHSYTDLFSFGHVVTNRDETSYGIVEEAGSAHLASETYRWLQAVLRIGGATRTEATCPGLGDYTCRRVEFPRVVETLPPIDEHIHGRYDFLPTYGVGAWSRWALTEMGYHGEFNKAGACVRNLNGDSFYTTGDTLLRSMVSGGEPASPLLRCGFTTRPGIRVIADGVRASVQSLFDAYVKLAAGEATLEKIAAVGSDAFAALRYLPIYVASNSVATASYGANHFPGRWVRYADAAQAIAGAKVLPADWQGCMMEYINGGSAGPVANRARCQAFPLIVNPPETTLDPGAGLTFVARGGSDADNYPDPPGYVWSFQQNGSGGMIDPATGAYTAGKNGGATDVILVTDSAGNQATARVRLTGGGGGGCGCSVPDGPVSGGALLALAALLARRTRRRGLGLPAA